MAREFKDIFKQLRKDSGLSGERLGALLGVHKTSVSNWEKGRNFPSTKVIVQLTEIFNVSIDYLLGTQEDEPGLTLAQKKVIADISDLNQEQQNYISEIIEALRIKNNGEK